MEKVESQILKAFGRIHSLGVVHGDVRRENILVDANGNSVWIIDFEYAEIIDGGLESKPSKIALETELVKGLLREIKKPYGSISIRYEGFKSSSLRNGRLAVGA